MCHWINRWWTERRIRGWTDEMQVPSPRLEQCGCPEYSAEEGGRARGNDTLEESGEDKITHTHTAVSIRVVLYMYTVHSTERGSSHCFLWYGMHQEHVQYMYRTCVWHAKSYSVASSHPLGCVPGTASAGSWDLSGSPPPEHPQPAEWRYMYAQMYMYIHRCMHVRYMHVRCICSRYTVHVLNNQWTSLTVCYTIVNMCTCTCSKRAFEPSTILQLVDTNALSYIRTCTYLVHTCTCTHVHAYMCCNAGTYCTYWDIRRCVHWYTYSHMLYYQHHLILLQVHLHETAVALQSPQSGYLVTWKVNDLQPSVGRVYVCTCR